MTTEELIKMLSTRVEPVDENGAWRILFRAIAFALPCSFVVMLMVFGLRHDLGASFQQAIGWIKVVVPSVIGLIALTGLQRLARPGARLGAFAVLWIAPLAGLWAIGIGTWLDTPPSGRNALIMGSTWQSCAFNIALVAAPLFVACIWALRRLAPTRPTLSGAMAGLASGAVGAAIYALHCQEMQAAFISIWYVLGIALPVAVGALAGPKLLRW